MLVGHNTEYKLRCTHGSYSALRRCCRSLEESDSSITGQPSILGWSAAFGQSRRSRKNDECKERTLQWTRNWVASAWSTTLPSACQISERVESCSVRCRFIGGASASD